MAPAWLETKQPGDVVVLLSSKCTKLPDPHQTELNLNGFYMLLRHLIQLFWKSVVAVHAKTPAFLSSSKLRTECMEVGNFF